MITKSYSKTGHSCRVTFKIPAGQAEARSIAVLGEWNGWNADAHPLERRKDGSWSATVTMEAGRPYRFRYLLDGRHWGNDEGADSAVVNQFGSEDSVVDVQAPAAAAEKKVSTPKVAKPATKTAKGNGKPAAKGTAKVARASKARPKPVAPEAEAAPKAPRARKAAKGKALTESS
jgi:1,4-alpha-glucan branching enzyme